MRVLLALLVVAAMSTLTLGLLAGHGPWAGDPIWEAFGDHGLNTGDLPVLAVWAVGVVCAVMLARRQ